MADSLRGLWAIVSKCGLFVWLKLLLLLVGGCSIRQVSPPEPVTRCAKSSVVEAGQTEDMAQQPCSESPQRVTAPDDDAATTRTAVVAQAAPPTDLPREYAPDDAITGIEEPGQINGAELVTAPAQTTFAKKRTITNLCSEIGNKLGSVSVNDCRVQNLALSDGWSVAGRPLAIKRYSAPESELPVSGRILVIGGIHGDEYASVSICFRWMEFLNQQLPANFQWLVVPLANPDGLLQRKSQRQNARGVDLNRNFPAPNFGLTALSLWHSRYGADPRRYPGPNPISEPETAWLVRQIEAFHPDVIISIHAPYDLLDYDGPLTAPERIGPLQLRRLGVFPGSLGNYAGLTLGVPVVTAELPYAGIMPSQKDIRAMWDDLVTWLRKQLPAQAPALSPTPG